MDAHERLDHRFFPVDDAVFRDMLRVFARPSSRADMRRTCDRLEALVDALLAHRGTHTEAALAQVGRLIEALNLEPNLALIGANPSKPQPTAPAAGLRWWQLNSKDG